MKTKSSPQKFAAAALALAVTGAASAQQNSFMMPFFPRGGETNGLVVQSSVDSSYTAEGKTKYLGTKIGDSDATSVNLGVRSQISINETWSVPLELSSQNYWLEAVPGAPVPTHINTLALGTGIGYRPNDDWAFVGRVGPRLYRFDDVRGDDIGVAGGVMALWNYRPELQFIFGVMVAPDSDLKALPLIGVNWRINERWDLRLIFPQPRLTYQPNEQWDFFAGANLTGTTFRSSDTLGTQVNDPRYNHALGTYRDVRVGAGVGWNFKGILRLEAEAGVSVNRQIDYTDNDQTIRFDPAAYVRAGIHCRF